MLEFKLADIAESQTGPFGTQLHEEDYVDEGTPIVTVEHLGEVSFSKQNLPHVSESDKQRLSKYLLREGDIVFSRVGSVDRCTYVSENEDGWLFSGRCLRVRVDRAKAYPKYVGFYFRQKSFKAMMVNISVGATMPSLNTSLMDGIPLRLPSIDSQQKIASVLSTLDDKIELNNRINTELEAMAKLIYEYWFMQFDFPHKEGKPYKATGGKMVWNEVLKREIPEEWKDGQIGDLIFLEYGKPLKEIDRSGKGFPVFGSNGIVGYHDNYLVEGPGIIIGRKGSAGEIQRTGENFFPIDTTYYVVDRIGVSDLAFHFHLLVNCNLKAIESSSAVPGLNRQIAHSIKTVVPPTILIRQFSKIVEPFFKSIDSNKKQNQELAALRDWLLPMLMNGQVTVGDAAVGSSSDGQTAQYQTSEEELNMAAEGPTQYRPR